MQSTRRQFLRQLGLAGLSLATLGCSNRSRARKPNIIYIMIDDLGYGDVGCYGSELNRTPHIDRLADKGMLFTDYHTNGPMCTPTRASLMTGKYQHRFGEKFEGPLSGKTQYDEGLPLEATTIAEALGGAGYVTGMYGKWHLGYKPPYLPPDQGFDEFIGLGSGDGDHHTHIDRSGRKDWWNNNKLRMEEGYSTDLITDHSVDFIQNHKNEPFFLYVAHLSIHFPWQGPDDPPHRVEGKDYADDKWGIIPDKNNVGPHVKAMVESIDDGVGRIMDTLKSLDLLDNTLVIFTSDNGGYTHYGDTHFNISSNGPLRGQKTELYEGGHRVPFIASWPGKIPERITSHELVMTMDMFPTFCDLAGANIPADLELDGISIAPHLVNQQPIGKRTVCWKMDDERAIRKGDWKLLLLGDKNPELYHLAEDIGETQNLASKYPDRVEELKKEYYEWEADVTRNYS